MKNAVILAAGLGKRLLPLTEEIPKCLVEVGSSPMLYYSIKELIANGFKEITLVTGYRKEKIQSFIIEYFGQSSAAFSFLPNPEYATKNNLYSVYIAKGFFNDETLLLNSDILYDPQILKYAVEAMEKSADSFLIVDDTKPLAQEEMKVITNGSGKIIQIGKWLNPSESLGEYIGILHLKGDGRNKFFEEASKMLYNGETDKYYEDALHRVCTVINLLPVSTRGMRWTEVDDHKDLEKAKGIALKIIKDMPEDVS